MPRTITIQVLRGGEPDLTSLQAGVSPLQMGEMFFTSKDTNKLYFGTPGFGKGYIRIGDTTNVEELLEKHLYELRAIRLALVHLAISDGKAMPEDFNPNSLSEFVNADDALQDN